MIRNSRNEGLWNMFFLVFGIKRNVLSRCSIICVLNPHDLLTVTRSVPNFLDTLYNVKSSSQVKTELFVQTFER